MVQLVYELSLNQNIRIVCRSTWYDKVENC